MNSRKRKITIAVISLLFLLLPFNSLVAQGPGNPPGGAGAGDAPIGGSAPIGGGSIILLGLAIAYGGKKVYDLNKNKEELEE